MESKIMQIFYGADCLPYKDQERVVHYPIVGQAFQGASQTTEIHFYIDRIGGNNATWVATAKLPNGKIGSQILDIEEDTELNENYVVLPLSSFYTQAQGNLFISLQGYDGGVEVEYDDETEIYSVVGTPVIQATGSVKIAINYSVQPIGSDELEELTIQDLLAAIGGKLNKNSDKYCKVVDLISNVNTSTYENYLSAGDIVYAKANSMFYQLTGVYPDFDWEEVDFKFNNVQVNGDIAVVSFNDIVDFDGNGLKDYIDNEVSGAVSDKIPQETDTTLTFAQLYTKYGNKVFAMALSSELVFIYLTEDGEDDTKIYISVSASSGSYVANEAKTNTISSARTYVSINNNDNIIVLTPLSSFNPNLGELNDTQKLQIAKPNAYLSLTVNGATFVFKKIYEDYSGYIFERVLDVATSSGVATLTKDRIVITKSSYMWVRSQIQYQTYTKDQIDTLFSSALDYQGSLTVAQVNALDTSTLKTGYFYNVTDSGIITLGNIEVVAGDNICWTGTGWDKLTMDLSAYDDKFIAAGFFEVQDYNQNTGEITMVYASDLYDMSYTESTGILTIEAN